jgi:hypothetical protein
MKNDKSCSLTPKDCGVGDKKEMIRDPTAWSIPDISSVKLGKNVVD